MRRVAFVALFVLLIPVLVGAQEVVDEVVVEPAPEPWEHFLGTWETATGNGYTYTFEFWNEVLGGLEEANLVELVRRHGRIVGIVEAAKLGDPSGGSTTTR